MGGVLGDVLINGKPVAPYEAAVSVFDLALQRGYGVFETIRSYQGVPFRLDAHLDRLENSAESLGMPLPARADIDSWVRAAAAAGECSIRLMVTAGPDQDRLGEGGATVVIAESIPALTNAALASVVAPWHSAGTSYDLTAAKSLSYAPNLAATLQARRAGYDDAVLVSPREIVLEGPTFGVGWVIDGVVETPGLDLGILASVTRAAVVDVVADLGLELLEGAFPLDRLAGADEAFLMSTVREVTPVIRIDSVAISEGEVTRSLMAGFRRLVAAEASRSGSGP